jgi:hypothetical protein
LTSTPTPTATSTPTATPIPPSANQPPEDNQDKRPKQTEEQRQDRQLTNRSGKDDVHTEGNVIAVERPEGASYVLVTIALGRNETLTVQISCQIPTCPDVRVGDYLEADGVQNGVGDPNGYFVATDSVEITRNGQRVR